MAQFPFRGNLQTMTFPLLSSLSGRTVIDPGSDQTFFPQTTTDGQVPIDRAAPQSMYCHNIMPSTYGYQSIDYENVFFAPAGGGVTFQDTHFIYGSRGGVEAAPTGFRSYIALGTSIAGTKLYVIDTEFYNFREVTGGQPEGITADTILTTAIVNGLSYIWFSGIGAYFYDDTIDLLAEALFTGLDTEAIIGIAASNGYMFAYKPDAIAWSSVVDVTDFEPSDISGAGGGQVQEAEGRIIAVRSTTLGIIVYTEGNAISVTYSGNEDFPWNFKAITGSGGIPTEKSVSRDQLAGYHYAYTTSGLQQISHVKCMTILPHVTDFLSGGTFEDFNSTTNLMTITEISHAMAKQLALVSDRYLVLSYGLNPGEPFSHAIIIDLLQSRMGKLKLPHTFVFDRVDITEGVVDLPRKSIALLQADGLTKIVSFSFDKPATDSVLLLGKFQLSRQRLVELQEVELENIRAGTNFQCLTYTLEDGKNLGAAKAGYLLRQGPDYKHYLFDAKVGLNCALLLKGTFNLITYVLWITMHGRF
jgi:hypothetical protein